MRAPLSLLPLLLCLWLAPLGGAQSSPPFPCLDESMNSTHASRLAAIAMEGLTKPYPNIIHHVMNSLDDVLPHTSLTPIFFGCYDWHSAVHTTWQLVRLIRAYPEEEYVVKGMKLLGSLLTQQNVAQEVAYLQAEGRQGFERPYGLAWLLQLVAELEEWSERRGPLSSPALPELDPASWRENLAPLEKQAVASLSSWLPKLTNPIRIGEHSQTAFSMGLVLDYARKVGNRTLEGLLVERTLAFHLHDREGPLHYEPSGHDFLSPCLGEADLMRRVLDPAQFPSWLASFLPTIPSSPSTPEQCDAWLSPVKASDPSDGKLAHFDGLNLSRAWMLEGVLSALPQDDGRRECLRHVVERHREAGMKTVLDEMDYMGSHWLGSFALYLSTCRGIPQ